MPTDHYATLKVERTASAEDIKKAWRRLARTTHPDVEGGSADAFREVQEAYEVLSDPVKRRTYDYTLSIGGASAGSSRPFTSAGPRPDFNAYAEDLLRDQLRRAAEARRAEAERLKMMSADLERLRQPLAPYAAIKGVGKILGEVYSAHRAAGVPYEQVASWRRTDGLLGFLVATGWTLLSVLMIVFAFTGAQTPPSAILTIVGTGVVAIFLMLAQLVGFNIYRFVNYSIPNRTAR
jgi:hypothetical protein